MYSIFPVSEDYVWSTGHVEFHIIAFFFNIKAKHAYFICPLFNSVTHHYDIIRMEEIIFSNVWIGVSKSFTQT